MKSRKLFAALLCALLCLLAAGIALAEESWPESQHPYGVNSNISWTYNSSDPNTKCLRLVFSENCELMDYYDQLCIVMPDGTKKEMTGTFGGSTIWVDGNHFSVNLISDSTVLKMTRAKPYGFSFETIEEFDYVPTVDSGSCGEHAEWTLSAGGMLVITGTGEMADYSYEQPSPFDEYRDDIRNIVIEDGITSIGDYAFFEGYQNVTNITIPDSVTEIGDGALSGLFDLSGIVLPSKLTSIGMYALPIAPNITIPESVTHIGMGAFCTNWKLTSITIPEGITEICELTFCDNTELQRVVLPDSLLRIGAEAFNYCSSLTSISIPDNVTEIEEYAFANCGSLKSINIPASLTSVGYGAFGKFYDDEGYYYDTPITDLYIEDFDAFLKIRYYEYIYEENSFSSFVVGKNETDKNPFSNFQNVNIYINGVPATEVERALVLNANKGTCGENVRWAISKDGTLTITGSGAMVDFEDESPWYELRDIIHNVVIEDGVTRVSARAFCGCSNLTSITIPDSVKSIGVGAFDPDMGCNLIEEVYVDSIESLISIDFESNPNIDGTVDLYVGGQLVKDLVIPDGVTSIGGGLFCSFSMTSVTIPDSVTDIGGYAFYNCDGLTSVSIPNNVLRIGGNAFGMCDNLCFVTIGNSVRSIGNDAFEGCVSLKYIYVPDSVTSMDEAPFRGCSSSMTIWCEADKRPAGWDNYWNYYGGSSNRLTAYFGISKAEAEFWETLDNSTANIVIPDGITVIPQNAFTNCSSLTDIHIPASVEHIYASAFDGCDNLKNLYIDDPDAFLNIQFDDEANPFTNVENVYINGRLATDVELARLFSVASGTCGEHVAWALSEDGVLVIFGSGAMANFSSTSSVPWHSYMDIVKNVVIEGGVTSIGNWAFCSCSSLRGITIPDCVTNIGKHAFSNCSSLASIILPDGVTSIGSSAFSGCSSLTGIILPNSVTGISSSAFSDCSNLTSIILPDGVTSISNSAFSGCSSLIGITIPDGVTSIGYGTFEGCTSLTNINIPDSVTIIGQCAFQDCSSLISITIPDSVTEIEELAFSCCTNLISINIPASLTDIAYGAFYKTNLTDLYIKNLDAYLRIRCYDCPIEEKEETGENPFQFNNLKNIFINGIPATEFERGLVLFTRKDNCGENVRWVLSSNGTLYIYGTGKMADYSYNTPAPWAYYGEQSYGKKVKDIIIENGVTHIGDYAFCCCSALNSITIPDSVKSIGKDAFIDDFRDENRGIYEGYRGVNEVHIDSIESLMSICFESCFSYPNAGWDSDIDLYIGERLVKDLVIPDGVTSIDNSLFEGYSISSVTIPDSVTSIGNCAFFNCVNLSSVIIPDSITSIGCEAFNYCEALNYIYIPVSVKRISFEEDCEIFDGCSSSLIICCGADDQPAGWSDSWNCYHERGTYSCYTTYFGISRADGEFWRAVDKSVSNIVIPNGVTKIPEKAFYNCTNLTSVTISNSVTSIGDEAFAGCSNLTSLTIKNSSVDIGQDAFTGCTGLTDESGLIIVNGIVFDCKKDATAVVIPDGVTNIRAKAFEDCASLKYIYIPSSVTQISASSYSDSPFNGCSSSLIIMCGAGAKPTDWGSYWNYYSSSAQITPYYGISASEAEFWGTLDKNAENIVIPEGITVIPAKTFNGCSGLTNVTIPDSVTSIGTNAFAGCTSLKYIYIPSSVTQVSASSYSYSPFYQCPPSLIIMCGAGAKPTGWGYYWNYYSSSAQITPYYGISASEAEFWGTLDKSAQSIMIPAGITVIPANAFNGCSGLENVTIPDSVTSIGTNAFAGCLSLKYIYIPSSVTQISASSYSYSPFYQCPSSLIIMCGASAKQAGWGSCWNYCSSSAQITPYYGISASEAEFWGTLDKSAQNIVIPDGITVIPAKAFYGCSGLENVTIPDSVTSIGTNAFAGCTSLKYIYIPSSVTQISASSYSYSPFYQCPSSLIIMCGAGAKPTGWGSYWNYYSSSGQITPYYGVYAADADFWGTLDKTAENIVIPDGITIIPDKAFYGCSGLKNVTIPDSVTSIGTNAFTGCSSLKYIYIPSSVTQISASSYSYSPFYQCPSSLIIMCGASAKPTGWGSYWNYYSSSGQITPYYGVYAADADFWGTLDKAAENIVIPDGITAVPSRMFYNCSGLVSVSLPESLKAIGERAFYGCRRMTGVAIPDSVSSIGNYAFYGCSSLTDMNIPNGVKSIGNYTFYDCSSLTGVTIPNSVTSIGEYAFYNCKGFTSVTIPDSVTAIGYNAFRECKDTAVFYLPDHIASIGSGNFYDSEHANYATVYCNPHTETSGALSSVGIVFYLPGCDEFCVIETDGQVTVRSYRGYGITVIVPDGLECWSNPNERWSIRMPSTLKETDHFSVVSPYLTIPDGVTSVGNLTVGKVEKLYIPASVTDLSGLSIQNAAPTVYCAMDSEAELWAFINGYDVVYTNAEGWNAGCSIRYVYSEYVELEVGETVTLSLKNFAIEPIPSGDFDIILVGDEYVTASGMTYTAVKPGYAEPLAWLGNYWGSVPMHIYQQPTYMKLEAPLFVRAGDTFAVSITETAPTDISGKFTWQQDGGTPVTDTVLTHTFTAPSAPGDTVITVTAPGGLQRSVTVHAAGSISAPYCLNNRDAVVGGVIGIYVDMDGVTYLNEAELYGTVTLPSGAAGILELTADNRVLVIGAGRTAFSVTGLDGKTVNIMVVAGELKNVFTLPASVITVEEEAFCGIPAQKVILPDGCTTIGSRAFANSASLVIADIPGTVSFIAADAFSGTPVTVHCPAGSYAESWCAENGVNCVNE